ncbi:MAG: acetyl ornithine aminotransferase family protein [Deltaproteobacteria bacterium]|nr:acetyl ornithine aminotransferase family protein [Deltaproteobacteria bacterium]
MRKPKIISPLPGPQAKATIQRDQFYLSPSYTRSYPLVIEKGEGSWVTDVDKNQFLDFTAGIAVNATGHSHPKVLRAIEKQSQNFIHMSGTDFYYSVQVDLAERLASVFPGMGPKKVFFANSGTESIEAAIKLARYHTGRPAIIAFWNAFHGRTLGALSLTASKSVQRNRFLPLVPEIYHTNFPDPRNCPTNMSAEAYASQCVENIREQIFHKILNPKQVAAIVVEPIQGEGGYIVPPKNFHAELQALCHEHDILYIVDEIQSGFGRTGKFFACEHFGVEPDIITCAKGIASGLPLGAMISRAEIMNWPPGAHASTFGGNPVACAAANTTFDLVQTQYMANAQKQGEFLKTGLKELKQEFAVIRDVRGLGLMLAFEIEKKEQKYPSHFFDHEITLRDQIIEEAFLAGLLLLPCGQNAVRLSPALNIHQEECEVALAIIKKVLKKI